MPPRATPYRPPASPATLTALRCKFAALAAGGALIITLLTLSLLSWQAMPRVERAAGTQLLAMAEQFAERLAIPPTPTQLEQLPRSMSGQNGELFVGNSDGSLLLAPADHKNVRLPPPGPQGARIQRWPDGQVYLTATRQHGPFTIYCRQALDIALAEVRDLQWRIFRNALPLILLAGLAGALYAQRRQRP